ncbi:hypothetical protein ACIBQ0_03640 [Nocardia nova]|uniref:hypothetical protein n=1 Tax=Nocardia nova TaxID=37330 RepID=UPI0037904D58
MISRLITRAVVVTPPRAATRPVRILGVVLGLVILAVADDQLVIGSARGQDPSKPSANDTISLSDRQL